MTATFQVGQILQGQEKFDEAIAAWQGLPRQVPQRPAVGRRPAGDPRHPAPDRRRPPRAASSTPRPAPPGRRSSPRTRSTPACPQVLFEVGESFDDREEVRRGDRRLGAARSSKFPGSEPAAHAQFADRRDLRDREGRPRRRDRAVPEGGRRALAVAGAAADRRDGGEGADGRHPARPSGRARRPTSRSRTRNLEKLTFTAYKLNAEAYFRKKHALGERRVARHRPGRPRRRVDRRRSPATPSTSRSRRPTTSRRSRCRASTSSR